MASAPSPSEILTLLLALLIVPFTVRYARTFDHPGARAALIGYLLVVGGALLAVAEHLVGSEAVSLLKFVMYAAGGVFYAVAWWTLAMALRRGAYR